MLIRFIRFVLGYVNFAVSGQFPERFLNQLALGGVSVWGIKRQNDRILASVKARDYLKFHSFKAKNRVVTHVTERCGLPFILKRHRLRVGFAAGLVFYVAILCFLSTFIWNIEIVGNQTLTDAELIAACERLGLREGVRRSSLDQELLRTRLALEFDNIAWASVNIEGVKATVNVSESKPSQKDPEEPCNLVASHDGIITALEVTDGTIKAKLGQTVKKGDLLVSGITEYKDGTYRFGTSAGRILAETDRELSCFIPFLQTDTVRIGEPVTRRVVSFFGFNVPLYLGSIEKPYEAETETKRYEKNGMYLPIAFTETEFHKTQTVSYTISEVEAKQKAEERLSTLEATELKDAEILNKSTEFLVTSEGVTLISRYKCRQNIATKDLLLILGEK